MKTFTLFIQFLIILNTLLYCNAAPSFIESFIQNKKDEIRDNKNHKSYKNIKRDIKFNGKRTLDVYYDKKNTKDLKPVFVFLYGGAWHSGSKEKYTKFGSLLESNDYVAVLPNYVLLPHGGFEDMVDDVYKAITWTIDNIKKYGGNPKRISLAGYSAGSHLTALTLFKSLFAYKNKNEFLRPLPTFEKVVLLNGPYDFDDYTSTLKFIGKTDNSLLEKFVKVLFKTKNVSPTDIIKEFPSNFVKSLGAKKFIFFYTSLDKEVRESSAKNLIKQMKRVCPSVNIKYVYKKGYEHTTLTRGVRAGKKEYEDVFMSLIRM